jgi:predicted ATPase/DNA-binding SARP family transcriptional activator
MNDSAAGAQGASASGEAPDPRHGLRAHRPLHLPSPLTDFVGRERELAELGALLESTRLLTLTGPGGSGKTRLALEAARRWGGSFADGVAWTELAALTDPALVPQAIAAAASARPPAGRDLVDSLAELLRPRRLLLVLDNCEHLVAACAPLVATLLERAPELRVLATSREVLGVGGEVVWPVPPLSLPASPLHSEDVSRAEAVRLFVARARAALPSFRLTEENTPAVARLCQRLDGIPLAIELAAARVRVLAPAQIVERLDDRFSLLTLGSRTAAPRQQTLRAAMDWSHALLDERERVLFRRLAVFAGSFTIDAVEAACAGDGVADGEVLDLLSRLVDKSLVGLATPAEAARYRLLETIRQYAGERLREAEGEARLVRDRHAAHFLALAEHAEPELTGERQGEWMDRLEAEHDNLRAALRHLLASGDATAAARLGGAVWRYWHTRGHLAEGRRWLEAALALPEPVGAAGKPARAKALRGAGVLAWAQGDYARARALFEAGVPLVRELGDEEGIAGLANNLGVLALHHAEYDRARGLFEESLALRRRLGDEWGVATSLNNLGATAGKQGHAALARGYYEESLALQRRMGNTHGTAVCLGNLAAIAYTGGDWQEAERLYGESLALRRHLGDRTGIADALGKLGVVALRRGEPERARTLYAESLPLLRELGDRERIARELVGIAELALARERPADAVRLLGAAGAIREAIGAPPTPDERREEERCATAARAALGEVVFPAAWAEGRALPAESAIDLAVDVLEPAPGTAAPEAPAPAPRSAGGAELRILALGPLEIRRGEHLVSAAEWGSAKPRELLLHLLEHPEGRTKEQIGLALWPDAAPTQLRSSFHFTLHHLRRALGRPEWIRYEHDRYRFDRSLGHEYDVEGFEAHLDRADRLRREHPPRLDEATRELEEAVHLYRGDFLEDSPFGAWQEERRDELRRRHEEALLSLGELLVDADRCREAAEIYRRALARDNLLETAHRGLMRCHARLGERDRALKHYPVLVALLREELQAEPEEETTALYERIRRGEEI